MGTNYYLFSTNREWVHRYFLDGYMREYELVEEPDLGYEIHLNKCSMGWRTLFEEHNKAYKRIFGDNSLVQFLNNNKEHFKIYNEYGEELSLEEYKDKVIDRDEALLKNPRYFVYDSFKRDLIEVTKDDAHDIVSPFDHIEYNKLYYPYMNHWSKIRYWNDEDGYNFSEGGFS